MTDDQKYETYARNRQKYHSMLQDGFYSNQVK
jgi:hypothetical protein